jgi:8-oxo-dGTP pyrophosphatase MutT (NUDIX family)
MTQIVKSAGIVVVKNLDTIPLFLLLASNGYWDFPKGKVEPDETEFVAALRETNEESGLKDIKFPWGGIFVETAPYRTKTNGKKHKKVARYYIGQLLSGEPELRPNPHNGIIEHDKFKWVSSSQKDGLELTPRIRKVLEWAIGIVEKDKNDIS